MSIFFTSNVDLTDHKERKKIYHLFDTCQFIMCYCTDCCKNFLLKNKYEAFTNLQRKTLRLSKFAIHDQEIRQKMFMDHAIESAKEGFIKSINEHDGRLVTKCPECIIKSYTEILDTMTETKKDVIELDKVHIFERNSCERILWEIESVYLKQLFAGYIPEVKDLRQK